MSKQSEISANKLSQKVGQEVQVVIDDITAEGVIARSWADAPEIDGQVIVELPQSREMCESLSPGDFKQVWVIDSDDYDLFGKFV